MVNRITRKVPISRYNIPYIVDGTVKTVEFETLSGLSTADLFGMTNAYIDMYEKPEKEIYFSSDYRETEIGVFTYEMPLTHFIEHAIRRGEKNIPEEE